MEDSYEHIKDRLAPCGLHCGKCFAFREGSIASNSRMLKEDLGEFDGYAGRFVTLLDNPVFGNYPAFKELLACFAEGECAGCRKEQCKLFKSCLVRGCSEEKGVDYCFQCPDFPCTQTGFDEHLHARFIKINRRMQEIGVPAYYSEIKDKPRY